MQELRLGDGGARRPKRSKEQLSLKNASKGCRAGGAGKDDIFKEQKQLVKLFAYRERSHGHTLTQQDLYLEFRQLVQDEIAVLEERQQQGSLEPGKGARLVACKNKLHRLSEAQNYLKTYKRQLQKACGLRLLQPQRFVRLSAAEEEARCHITWQEYDYQM